jgi:glycerol-3-phosphate acyltransferase PlsX
MDGRVDIAVCDGFIGNVVLKFAEGLAESILSFLRNEISNSLTKRMGFFFLKPSFVKLKKVLDYAEYGGAPLLGINGYCIICHGKSNAKAIKNAIKQAKNLINSDLNYYIEEEIR